MASYAELSSRFEKAWEKLATNKAGIPSLENRSQLHTGSIKQDDGRQGMVWISTYFNRSFGQSPDIKAIDLLLPDNKTLTITENDVRWHCWDEERMRAVDTLDQITLPKREI